MPAEKSNKNLLAGKVIRKNMINPKKVMSDSVNHMPAQLITEDQ
jgi:hypothetical protein